MSVPRGLVLAWLAVLGGACAAAAPARAARADSLVAPAAVAPARATSAGGLDSLATSTALPRAPGVGWQDLLRAEEKVEFSAGQARRPLVHSFLQFGSEVVQAGDSVLVRNRDYGIDYGRGVLFLLAPPTAAVPLTVRYLYLPAPRQRSFHAATIASRDAALGGAETPVSGAVGAATTAPPGAAAGARPDLAAPSTLRLAGSNSVGISFGRNREATLDQSLRVEAAGEIGEGLHVDAVLADDNLPVTAEGSTEELGDLNKVFIEMQGPVVGGVLGDYTLERPPGEFVALRRELRGGELRLRGGGQRLALGAGLPKGELVTVNFLGTEGRQGPYELLSARRVEFTTLVPGSERVYLDGLLLRRGENQDYVIDFDRGELRFTSRRRITADSEIAAEFQVNGGGYRRQSRDVQLDSGRTGLRVQGLLFAEGDDQDRPLDAPLDAADRAALAAAGDHAVVGPGIRNVGAGRGLYRYAVLDSTIVVYDPTAGDLDVDFYELGGTSATYDDSLDVVSGRRIYRYVGAGRGHFAVGRQLTPPNWLRLASARLDGGPWRGARLAGEFSLSDFDANRFSSRDDGDNTGAALDVTLQAGRAPRATTGGAGVQVHVSQLAARFHPPGRVRTPYYYKDWNAEGDTLQGTERIAETTLGWGAGGARPWMRVDANVGRLDRGAELVTDRAQVDWVLGRDVQRSVDVRWQSLDSRRDAAGPDAGRRRQYLRTGARFRLASLVPAVQLETDEFVRDERDSLLRPSYRYADVTGRISMLETARTTAAVTFVRRDTDARRSAAEMHAGLGEWAPSRRNDTYMFEIGTRPVTALTGDLALSRRTNQPRGTDAGAETRSDLARTSLLWMPRTRAARAEWRYELSDEVVRTLQEVLVLAPDGHGDYDAEGRPVGKDQGTYDKVIRYAAQATPVRQAETSLRLELGGQGRIGPLTSEHPLTWWRRNLSWMQLLALQELTQSGHAGDLMLLRPSILTQPGTLFGNFKARQEWSFLNASTRSALKLFLDWQESVDGRLTDNTVHDRDRTGTLRFEWNGMRRWTYGTEAGLGRRERRGRLDAALVGRPSSGTYDVRSEHLVGRAAYRFSASERFGVDLDLGQQRDARSETRQVLLTLSPSLTLAPLRSLRLLATLAATRVQEDKPVLALAPYFFDPPGTKTSASFLGSYRLGQSLHFDVTYAGQRNTDGRFTYDVKMETRALF
jgi:hypothetical protein